MPYLPPNLQKRQQQVAAPTLGGSAPTMAVGSSPSAAAPTAAPVNTGSGWTNLQDYLSANSAPLAAEVQHVGQEVAPKATAAMTANQDPRDYGMGTGPAWLDHGGTLTPNPGIFNSDTSSPLFSDEQKQQAKDLLFEFQNKSAQPGLDQWLRNASGVQGAWDEATGKYKPGLEAVAGYQWNQPTQPEYTGSTGREPVGKPGDVDPTTGEVPPPIGGPWSGLPSSTNPDQQGGYNTGVDVGGAGPASQGTPGGMFGFDQPPKPPATPPPDKNNRNAPTPTRSPTRPRDPRMLTSWLMGR